MASPNQVNTPHYLIDGDSTDGTVIAPNGGPVGFFGATPAPQPTALDNTHTVAAGSTTAVYTNTTFDGSIGTTAYTVGDIVAALKTLGIIKS
ncbi:MAG TPA: hypothetical protein PL140_09155 [Ferrovaceae bacterium]|nr:hypothetical protein [Ferrovaceae bacterium]